MVHGPDGRGQERGRKGVHRGVLLVGPLPPPSGGIASHITSLVASLSRRGWAAAALDPGRTGAVRLFLALCAARLRRRIVHVHVCGHNRSSYLLALLAGLLGARFLTLHSGLAPPYLLGLKGLDRALVTLALGLFTRVVAVSPEVAAALGRMAGRALRRPPLVLPAYVAVEPDPGSLPAAFDEARRRHGALLVAHVGTGREYGAAELLEALATLTARDGGIGLVLLGSGGDALAVREGVERLGLAGRVHPLGDLERPAALAVMAACDLFVRPTLADGDSGSVREALALGVPVVATAVGRRPPGVRLCPPGNPEALAAAIAEELAAARPSMPPRPGPAPIDPALATLLELYEE